MHKKLTLNINDELIGYTHRIADKSKDTISHIVSVYLEKLRNRTSTDVIKDPFVKKLYGSVKLNRIPDKKKLGELYLKKHLK